MIFDLFCVLAIPRGNRNPRTVRTLYFLYSHVSREHAAELFGRRQMQSAILCVCVSQDAWSAFLVFFLVLALWYSRVVEAITIVSVFVLNNTACLRIFGEPRGPPHLSVKCRIH